MIPQPGCESFCAVECAFASCCTKGDELYTACGGCVDTEPKCDPSEVRAALILRANSQVECSTDLGDDH